MYIDGTVKLGRREFIIAYLLDKGAEGAFVNEMNRAWAQYKQKPSNYASFRALVYAMRKEGILIVLREEPGKHNFPRRYYGLARPEDYDQMLIYLFPDLS